jgi:ketosteroid isomerase-like protein
MTTREKDWIADLFAGLDNAGVEALFPYLHDDVHFRFASYPAGTGKQAFADAWAAMSSHIESLHHKLLDSWQMNDAAACRGEVTYTLTDGRAITLPFANIFKLRDGLISDYLIYIDASSVFGVYEPG